MMNTYLRTSKFTIDGVLTKVESWYVLIDDSKANKEIKVLGNGKTFESLWSFMTTSGDGILIPGNAWLRAFWSKKRRIEFFTKTKTWVDDGIEREWELSIIDEPAEVSMERLYKFDSEKVVKYLVERGLTIS